MRAGGAMVVAFPHLYAAAFSGFYLPLMIVLWLLILRGVAIEFRHQVDDPLWQRGLGRDVLRVERRCWPCCSAWRSATCCAGVPLDADGEFLGSFALLLNPFALLVRRAEPGACWRCTAPRTWR